MRFPVLGKVAALGAVAVALLVGLESIDGIVKERQATQRSAEQGLADSLAGTQAVVGPVLQRRCTEAWDRTEGEGDKRRTVADQRQFVLSAWPRSVQAEVQVGIEPLHRGLFKLNSYLAKTELQAEWADLSALRPVAEHPGGRVACEAPMVSFAVSDARGIQSATLRAGAQALTVRPGSPWAAHPAGLHGVLADATASAEVPLRLSASLNLAGTGNLSFVPVGDDTRVKLGSNWAHPSFGGRFLPVERQITDTRFDAQWQVSALASTARHGLQQGVAVCGTTATAAQAHSAVRASDGGPDCVDSFGVSFIDPVNPYVLSDRAIKYGLLFIALTFVGVGLVEVMRRLRVHPLQYLLVGCALTLFFLMLVSLSEHFAFGWSYLGASAACSLLLTYYAAHVLRGWGPGLVFGTGIAGLYGALYALLQMEQTAMVLGSALLFVVLAVVMVATRRLDWYALMAQMREPTPVRPTPAAD